MGKQIPAEEDRRRPEGGNRAEHLAVAFGVPVEVRDKKRVLHEEHPGADTPPPPDMAGAPEGPPRALPERPRSLRVKLDALGQVDLAAPVHRVVWRRM